MIEFRSLTRDDFSTLASWLSEPHVARWWNHEWSPEAIERDFGGVVDGHEAAENVIVSMDQVPVGLMQFFRLSAYPEYRDELASVTAVPEGAASIDYLIGPPERAGRGLGTEIIGEFCRRVWAEQADVTCMVVAVATANRPSWRALMHSGFRLVGQGQLEPDNPIDDGSHEVLRLDRPSTSPA